MRSSFLGFEAAKRSIQVSQKALDITFNNISNRDTEGYTRQRLDLASANVSTSSLLWNSSTAKLSLAGQGVVGVGVAQLRDTYIDKRYRENVAVQVENERMSEVLSEVEDILDNIETDGLKAALEDFENKLHNYSAERPDSEDIASVVRNSAQSIAQMLRSYDTKLTKLHNDQISELGIKVDNFNSITSKIADLNEQIKIEYTRNYGNSEYSDMMNVSNYGPNELIDARNLLLDDLAKLASITVEEKSDGSVTVSVGKTTVVEGKKTSQLIMRDYEQFDAAVLMFDNGDSFNSVSGEIKSYVNLINGAGVYASGNENNEYGIPYYKYAVDQFAQTFAQALNSANGADLNPERKLFSSDTGNITAGTIKVSDEWMKDATMIAQTLDEDTGEYSLKPNLQNTNIAKIISSINQSTDFGVHGDFTGDMHEYIAFYSNRLFQQIDYVNSQYDSAETTVVSLLESRDSLSAIDLEEEGINMLNYQKWFNASARMMTTLDEALDTIINSMGLVGR